MGDAGSEEKWASLAAALYPDVTLHRVDAIADDWIPTLRRIAWHMDDPAGGVPALEDHGEGAPGADELLGS
jgi:hypothetical protein